MSFVGNAMTVLERSVEIAAKTGETGELDGKRDPLTGKMAQRQVQIRNEYVAPADDDNDSETDDQDDVEDNKCCRKTTNRNK